MTDIFFSYSREDKDRVAFIAAALEAEGYDLWWDTDIAPGETYRSVTQAKLREAKCVIVVWSEASVHSRWVIGEAEEGLTRDILLPIMIDDVVREVPIDFRSVQAANLARWKGDRSDHEWKKVLASVKRFVEQPAKTPQTYRKPKRASGGGRAMTALALFMSIVLAGGGFLYWSATQSDEQQASGDDPSTLELAVGERFRDCAGCPEMVVVPAGSFRMGDLNGGGDTDEKPVHTVTFAKPFAVGVFEVTFDEWDACVAAGSCGDYRPADQGVGRGRRPVIYVSWEDAQGYVAWLSRKTGKNYRLLSEAEWEYAARAGSATKYHFGNSESTLCRYANGADLSTDYDWRNTSCSDGYGKQTAPAGSFQPNAFGLYDVHGNVWEWVGDCWNDSYSGAPANGRAWEGGDCTRRVLRGGSWSGKPRDLRAANRARSSSSHRNGGYGFRLSRTLD